LSAALANGQLERFRYTKNLRTEVYYKFIEKLDKVYGVKIIKGNKNEEVVPYTYKLLYVADDILEIDKYVQLLKAVGLDIVKSTTLPMHITHFFKNNYTTAHINNLENSVYVASKLIIL